MSKLDIKYLNLAKKIYITKDLFYFRCLLTAARLCSRLELHSRVGEVLSPLSQLLCSATAAGTNRKAGFSASTAVSLSSVLAMEVVMEEALEFGSQAEDCWKHIMR